MDCTVVSYCSRCGPSRTVALSATGVDSTRGLHVCARARTVVLGSAVCDLIEIQLGVILQLEFSFLSHHEHASTTHATKSQRPNA